MKTRNENRDPLFGAVALACLLCAAVPAVEAQTCQTDESNIWTTDEANRDIVQIEIATGNELNRIDTAPDFPSGFALRDSEQIGFVGSANPGGFYLANLGLGALGLVAPVQNAMDVVLNRAEDTAWVNQFFVNGDLVSVDLSNGSVVPVASGLENPIGLWVNHDESTAYVVEALSETLSAVDMATGAITPVATGFVGIRDVAIDPDESFAYVADERGLVRVDLRNGSIALVNGAVGSLDAVELNATGRFAYVGPGGGGVRLVDLATGLDTPVSGSPTRPFDLDLNLPLTPSLHVGAIADGIGGSVTVPILLTEYLDPTVPQIDSVTLELAYDANVLLFQSIVRGDNLVSCGAYIDANPNPGTVIVQAANCTIDEAGPVALVEFLVIGTPSSVSPLTFTSAQINGGAASLVTCDGSVCAQGFTGEVQNVVAMGSSFAWDPLAGADGYMVYRAMQPDLSDLACLGAAPTTSFTDPTVPPPGGAFYYQVAGTSCGFVSNLGTTSSGAPRAIPSPMACP